MLVSEDFLFVGVLLLGLCTFVIEARISTLAARAMTAMMPCILGSAAVGRTVASMNPSL